MNLPRRLTVLLSSDLLTLSRACGVLRRRNLPIRALAVDSNGPPGIWRMSGIWREVIYRRGGALPRPGRAEPGPYK